MYSAMQLLGVTLRYDARWACVLHQNDRIHWGNLTPLLLSHLQVVFSEKEESDMVWFRPQTTCLEGSENSKMQQYVEPTVQSIASDTWISEPDVAFCENAVAGKIGPQPHVWVHTYTRIWTRFWSQYQPVPTTLPKREWCRYIGVKFMVVWHLSAKVHTENFWASQTQPSVYVLTYVLRKMTVTLHYTNIYVFWSAACAQMLSLNFWVPRWIYPSMRSCRINFQAL
jgi:hypothetical protein